MADYKEQQKKDKELAKDRQVILCQYCEKEVKYRKKGKIGVFSSPFVKASDGAYVHKTCKQKYEMKLSIDSFSSKEVK